MKYNPSNNKTTDSLLSWEELLEKGNLLRDTIERLSLTPGISYSITKACTDGTFQEGDVIILEENSDLFCPKSGQRITPGKCTKENLDFSCVPLHTTRKEG